MHRLLLPLLLAVLTPVTAVPARRVGKTLYVPVRIDGRGPFWFCFDSGAHHTIVDPYLVQRLGLVTGSAGTTRGTGQGDVPIRHVAPFVLTVGTAKLAIADPWEIDLSGTGNPTWMHGLIGADLLEAYVVEMNPDRPSLRLFDPAAFAKPAGAVAVPMEAENHRFFMNVTIDVNDKLTVVRRARIDTGSEDSVDDVIVSSAREVRKTTLGHGLGKNYEAVSGIFDAVHIGPFTIRHVWGPGTPWPAIGMEMFRRFTTTFDVAHRTIYLVPNGHLGERVPAPDR